MTPGAWPGRSILVPFLRLVVTAAQSLGVAQVIFPQPLRQHFMLPGHWLSTWHWSSQMPSLGKSTLGQEPCFSRTPSSMATAGVVVGT